MGKYVAADIVAADIVVADIATLLVVLNISCMIRNFLLKLNYL